MSTKRTVNKNKNEKVPKKTIEEYEYFQVNDAFALSYVNEFITRALESQFIPDLLIESLHEIKANDLNIVNNKLPSEHFARTSYKHQFFPNKLKYDGNQLMSDVLLDELVYENFPTPQLLENSNLGGDTDRIKNTRDVKKFVNQTAFDSFLIDQLLEKVKLENTYVVGDDVNLAYSKHFKKYNELLDLNDEYYYSDQKSHDSRISFMNNANSRNEQLPQQPQQISFNNIALLNSCVYDLIEDALKNDILPKIIQDAIEMTKNEMKQTEKINKLKKQVYYDPVSDNAKSLIEIMDSKSKEFENNKKLFDSDFLESEEIKPKQNKKPQPKKREVRLRKF